MTVAGPFETLAEAVIELTRSIMSGGDIVEAPDWDTRRKEFAALFSVTNPFDQTKIPKATICNDAALVSYVREIILGTLDHAVESGKETYTYHQRMVEPLDQIEYCLNELKRNPGSARAVITVRRPDDCLLVDQPCLQLIQFKMAYNKLNMTTYWRSRDLFKALYMNCFALILFGIEFAKQLGVEFGMYTDYSESLHIYERDWVRAENISSLEGDFAYIISHDFWNDYKNPFDDQSVIYDS